MTGLFFLVFTTVFLVEFGDKTQLVILLLSSRSKQQYIIFLGAMTAFLLAGGIAVIVGVSLTKIIPQFVIKILSSLIFILLGILALKYGKKLSNPHPQVDQKSDNHWYKLFFSSFTMVFFAEIGDKSQIALALYAAKHSPLLVYSAGMTSLACIALLTVYLGTLINTKINERFLSYFSGLLFILIGVLFSIV